LKTERPSWKYDFGIVFDRFGSYASFFRKNGIPFIEGESHETGKPFLPWNKGRLVGQKASMKLKEI